MGTGILVCGLNGSGKSTLGKALAKALELHFIDNEDMFFPKTDPDHIYASPRPKSEVERLLMSEVTAHENFVFAAVHGDYGKDIIALYDLAILVEVPRDIRMQRVRDRSFQKFGSRMLSSGDLYEQEEQFFQLVSSRPEDMTEKWLQTLQCPIIKVDGTKPVEENINIIQRHLHKEKKDYIKQSFK